VETRYLIIHENGLKNAINENEDGPTAMLKYVKPAYVTNEIMFGDPEADYTHIWTDTERTPEEAAQNKLSELRLKKNEDGKLVGIQLIFQLSGPSPIFEASGAGRLL